MIGAKPKIYKFFKMSGYIREVILDYDNKDKLLTEWITLDTTEKDIERRVINISNVFADIGGIQHLLVLIAGFIFKPYTFLSFREEAFNEFFTIETKDKKLLTENNKVHVSWFNKARLVLGLCPNSKLRRLLSRNGKGENRLLRELDMCRIVNDIKKL